MKYSFSNLKYSILNSGVNNSKSQNYQVCIGMKYFNIL